MSFKKNTISKLPHFKAKFVPRRDTPFLYTTRFIKICNAENEIAQYSLYEENFYPSLSSGSFKLQR